jgi:enoyl-CoA hydratase/carnithine racemase
MNHVDVDVQNRIGFLVLNRGKVNALIGSVVEEIKNSLVSFRGNPDINAVILTGKGKFFSFGFDIPEFLSYTKEEFTNYLIDFTNLYTYMFTYPKPIVAALNGHTVAGGCMLALACDHRFMVSGNAKISLNEINFGSSVFAGSTEMLRYWVGSKNAATILYSGEMYSAEKAKSIGLVDDVTTDIDLIPFATQRALELGEKHNSAFRSIKKLLRKSIKETMKSKEKESIIEFVDIWYSDFTWKNLKNIKIR